MSTEKVSTLTLRLTAEEAEQLERLKALVGKSTGREALKYVMKEDPRFCAHYREEAKLRREREQEFTEMRRALCGYVEALQRLQAVALRE